MTPSAAKEVLVLTGEQVVLAVPDACCRGGGEIFIASLYNSVNGVNDNALVGTWEFVCANDMSDARLVLSPNTLDHFFLVLDHPDVSPVAQHHQVFAPSILGCEFYLTLSSVSGPSVWFHLVWPSPTAASQQVMAWRRAQVPPAEWFYVELTTNCNLRCPFCPSQKLKRGRTFMPLEMVELAFRNIADHLLGCDRSIGYMHVQPLVFLHVMGEPLLHPEFMACIELSMDMGLRPALFTNATLLTDRNIEKVLTCGLSHVTLSINTVDEGGYKSLGAPGDFESQQKRVEAFLRRRSELGADNIHVDIQYLFSNEPTPLITGIIQSQKEMWRMYRQWLLLTRSLQPPSSNAGKPIVVNPEALDVPFGSLANEDPSRRFPLDRGVDLVFKTSCTFGNAVLPEGVHVAPTTHGQCPFGNPWRQAVVFADGSVSFCNLDYENSVDLGNLANCSLDEIWYGERMQSIRNDMQQNRLKEHLCQQCLGDIVSRSDPDWLVELHQIKVG